MSSAINPQQTQEFYMVLNALLSPNNDERNKAEAALKHLRLTNPDVLVACLITALKDVQNVPNQVRQMVISVLRNTLIKKSSAPDDGYDLWLKFQEPTRDAARKTLMETLTTETFPPVRRLINTTIADVASIMFELSSEKPPKSPIWSDLLPFLFK